MRRITAAAFLLAGAAVMALPVPAVAQTAPGARAQRGDGAIEERTVERRARPRIRVTPSRRLVRQCVDWYEVEQRATGPTVVPNMRCWWAAR